MTIGIFDTFGTLCFLAATLTAVRALFMKQTSTARVPLVFLALAALAMTYVNLANALNNLGITDTLHGIEEYAEVLFLPLLAYMMVGLQRQSVAEREEREHEIVGRLGKRLTASMAEMGKHRLGMLQALSAAVDARDHYTAQHSMHVADYASAIGYRMGMRDQILLFEQAGLLHDIGKIGVPDTLLLKPARLTDEEYREIQLHVEESAHIIATVPFLADVVPMVRHHHERWDGTGYPDRLAGEAIPRESRVLAVADAFDAMTTDRPYRSALPLETAKRFLLEGSGSQFDPQAVDTMIQLLDEGIIAVGSRAAVA